MFREYSKALFKRVDTRQLMQFRPPVLPPRIYSKQINVDNKHYAAYCQEMHWPKSHRMHPVYLQMLSLPLQMQCLLDKKSPFPLLGLIHGKNDISVLGDCDLSAPFECRVRFGDVRPHNRGWEFDILLEAFQQGQRVYQAISSYLVKVKAVHVAPKPVSLDSLSTCDDEAETPIDELTVTADTGRRYAKLSGDYNPIHLYGLTAKLFGFHQPIAHGMWTLARSLSSLMENEERDVSKLTCSFKRPVYLPSKVQVTKWCEDEVGVQVTVSDHQKKHKHMAMSVTF